MNVAPPSQLDATGSASPPKAISARCGSPRRSSRARRTGEDRGVVQLGGLPRAELAVGRGARIFRDPQPGGAVRHLADGEVPHRGAGRRGLPQPRHLRDVAKLKPGRVHYTAWCDDEGHVLDDGTLFRLAETRFRLCCQERHLPWLLDSAIGFDVVGRRGDRGGRRAGACRARPPTPCCARRASPASRS